MANGELMATRLGAAFLAREGIDVAVARRAHAAACRGAPQRDRARELPFGHLQLRARSRVPAAPVARPARCSSRRVSSRATRSGDTVLLGRGGSDTSGSYFAAKLGARRLEIWTDVPGMFTANPHAVPSARLLRSLDYDEAQEIASSGAKVLHPRCILPVKQYCDSALRACDADAGAEGTVVTPTGGDGGARVKAVCIKKGITLVSMETLGMWHQVGFLADAFAVFKDHGLSIDLVSTSETSVTVSLDPAANALEPARDAAAGCAISALCRVEVIGPVRRREPRRPQHPRDAASPRRRAGAVRGAARSTW